MDERIIKIQEHYGLDAQTEKCMEELEELEDALASGNENAIIGEIADVYIMLAQIESLRKIVAEVEVVVNNKLDRTIKQIEDEEND